jgi:hypothetical protein
LDILQRDEVFAIRRQDGDLACLTGTTMQDEIKKKCASDGLSFNLSAKSLRKVAIAHMRAQGVSEDDR